MLYSNPKRIDTSFNISSWLISNGTFHNANIFQNWWIIHAGLTLWFSPTANLSQNWIDLVSQGLPSIKCYDPSILIKRLYITRIIMVNHIIVLYGLSNIWDCQIVYQLFGFQDKSKWPLPHVSGMMVGVAQTPGGFRDKISISSMSISWQPTLW